MIVTKKFLKKLDQIFKDTYPVIYEDETAVVKQLGVGDYRIDWKEPVTKDNPEREINIDGITMPDIERLKKEILDKIKAECKLRRKT